MKQASKEYERQPEHTQIADVNFLDLYRSVIAREGALGLKYPNINFPSGRVYEVFDQPNDGVGVRLFGEFAVPIFANRDRAFTHLKALITPTNYIAYFVHPVDDNGVLIWGKNDEERLLITYDLSHKMIGDIQGVTGTIGAYRVNEHRNTHDIKRPYQEKHF